MDGRTEHELKKVTAGVPDHLQKVTRDIVDLSEEEVAKEALKRHDLPSGTRRRLEEAIARGDFRRTETVIDEDVVKELDKYHDEQIRKLRASGKLPDPKQDKWLMARAKRMEAREKNTPSLTLRCEMCGNPLKGAFHDLPNGTKEYRWTCEWGHE